MPFYIFKTEVSIENYVTIEADNKDEAYKRYEELEMDGAIEPETSDASRFERDYYIIADYDTKEAYEDAESKNYLEIFYKDEDEDDEA